MARKLRVEYPGAIYHLVNRGDRREPIFRWSSFGEYLQPPTQRAGWVRVDRLLGELRIPEDSAAGRAQFEELTEERRRSDDPAEWKAVRRGWCLGEEVFRQELLEQMSGQMGSHHGGSERLESAEAKAERILAEELARRGWGGGDLDRRAKSDREKIAMVRRLRTETTMPWGWIAQRLEMGTAGYAASCLRQTQ